MGGRYERWQRPRLASHPEDVRGQADRRRHWPLNYAEYRNRMGPGFPSDRKYSEMREDHSRIPRKDPPKHHRRNGLTYTTPARKDYVHSVSKRPTEKNHRRTVRQSISLPKVMTRLDCSAGPAPAQRGSARLRG